MTATNISPSQRSMCHGSLEYQPAPTLVQTLLIQPLFSSPNHSMCYRFVICMTKDIVLLIICMEICIILNKVNASQRSCTGLGPKTKNPFILFVLPLNEND